MIKIIGLTGPKGCGKSTVGEFIQANYPEAKTLAIADKLKKTLAESFNMNIHLFLDPELKEKPLYEPAILTEEIFNSLIQSYDGVIDDANYLDIKSRLIGYSFKRPRDIMQIVGTEILRGIFGADVHVKSVPINGDYGVYIINDVRFENEFEYIKGLDSELISVVVAYVERKSAEDKVENHPSELQTLKLKERADLIIDNNGSLENTRDQVNLYF